jgi:uracil phosphoribosyltransferase
MVYEMSREFELNQVKVKTPIAETIGYQLKHDVVIVPILRAGLGMTNGISNLIPSLKIAHVGMYRDPETLEPKVYYQKFPANIKTAKVIILDPLLATGGSVIKTIDILKEQGVKDIVVLSLIGVMYGIKEIEKKHPDIKVYLAALDERLNDHAYIVPGLGDAGDRLFGTK